MKRELKGFLVGVILTAVLTTSSAFAEGIIQNIAVELNSINISVNGQKVAADNILYNGRTYVPISIVAQMFGKEVGWDANTNTASINDKATAVVPQQTSSGQNEYTVKDANGKALYSLKINKITAMSERNQFSTAKPAQVILIDYTYTNLASNEEVYLGDIYFKVIDSQGKIGYTYPNSVSKYPQKIATGVTCDAQMIFGLDNSSSKVKVCFYKDLFGEMTTSFDIPVK
ncbi:MAG TPA: stalk domain-containing protein [Syntrophomonadaceae bacterium]|nr:stalk domain-containing protein [Syntrophomonadaceae bacterium]